MNILRWFNQHDQYFRLLVFLFSLLPAVILFGDWCGLGLGINPFAALIERTGFWAMFFLILTLSITPLRRWLTYFHKLCRLRFGKRLADWNFLIRARRMLGLYSFFYLCWHMGIYWHLELGWQWSEFLYDLSDRLFVGVGLAAWVLSLLLALTSPTGVRRRMGRQWRKLHRVMYLLCVLAVIHVLWEAKLGDRLQWLYAFWVFVFLTHRIMVHYITSWVRKDDTGLEAER